MIARIPFLSICAISLWEVALGQSSVPSDLSRNFDPSSISLQVSYDGDSANGFNDGSRLTVQQTSRQPVFALGDSSGVNTVITYLVMMVDTTTNNRVLHLIQPDLKAGGEKTGLESASSPAFSYKAPGSLGESGTRTYSFLLFVQKGNGRFSARGLPSAGSSFNIDNFASSNSLTAAQAGVAMQVNVGGGGNNGGNTQQQPPQVNNPPASAPFPAPAPAPAPIAAPAPAPAPQPVTPSQVISTPQVVATPLPEPASPSIVQAPTNPENSQPTIVSSSPAPEATSEESSGQSTTFVTVPPSATDSDSSGGSNATATSGSGGATQSSPVPGIAASQRAASALQLLVLLASALVWFA